MVKINSSVAALTLLAVIQPTLAQNNRDGFIYGTITTDKGEEVSGVLRWDDEESYWHDQFNGLRDGMPHLKNLTEADQETVKGMTPGPEIELFGMQIEFINFFSDEPDPKMADYRFGDIAEIKVLREERVEVTFNGGEKVTLIGGSNDFDVDVQLRRADGGTTEYDWDDIEKVTFSPGPESMQPFGQALTGTVQTENAGTFVGTIEWDHDERLGFEELDGEVEGVERAVPFSNLTSIERDYNRSKVTTKDGETVVMTGTNDVDDGNRGIIVDTGMYRVDMPWTEFVRADWDAEPTFSMPRSAFSPVRALRGTVRTTDGQSYSGNIVWDIDEYLTADHLDGRSNGIEYFVPFANITRMEAVEDNEVKVTLTDGQVLTLGRDRDVDGGNQGIAIYVEGQDTAHYITRSESASVEFR